MPYGLYLSAEGARAQSRRMEVLANNLANVDTVGFKRQLAIFQARDAEAHAQGIDQPGSGSINDVGGGIHLQLTKTDFSTGPLKQTDVPTDMAIDGEGFFLVRKGEEHLLTRAGNFRLNQRGELLTQQGYPVLTEMNEPVVIDPTNGPWTVSPAGVVRQRGAIQTLALVGPESLGDLVQTGENLFRPLDEPKPIPAAQRRIVSGYLEQSGVQPTSEMVELIETSRAIEANVNLMQTQDQMLSGLVNRVMRS